MPSFIRYNIQGKSRRSSSGMPIKMNNRNSSQFHLFFRRHGRCIFITCCCLFMLLLLHKRYSRDFDVKPGPSQSLSIHVSNIWVVKDNQRFTNKEYDDLLTSSLRSPHFEPSPQQPAEAMEKTSWEVIIEGDNDYFSTADDVSDFEISHQRESSTTCRLPVRNVLFLKTHYTGSDVITNIFNRFADVRDLLMALPNDGLSSFYWPSKFDWRYMDMRRLQGNLPQVLCNHARYNPDVMGQFMPFNTHYVTILRNPLDHFTTVFEKLHISRIMDIHSVTPLETFMLHPKTYIKKAIHYKRFFDSMNLLKNGMFFDLGLHTSDYDQTIAITNTIFDLQKKFSVVLIHEYLDESLILMKRKLCWNIDDIIYLRSAFPLEPHASPLSLRTREAISKWNKADWILYEFFNATLWQSIRAERDFYSEVIAFKARQKELESYCSGRSKETKKITFALADVNFTSTTHEAQDMCDKMTMAQENYLEYFRQKYE